MPTTRRTLLGRGSAAFGALLAGCGGVLGDRECTPDPVLFDPETWPLPRADPANTGHVPARAAPPEPVRSQWVFDEERIDAAPLPPRPTVADGTVFFVSKYLGEDGIGPVVVAAFDATDGRVRWRRTFPLNPADVRLHPLVVADGRLLLRTYPKNGDRPVVFSLDTATGETRARRAGRFATPPTLAAGRVHLVEDRHADDTETATATAVGPALDGACWRTDLVTGRTVRIAAPGVGPSRVVYPVATEKSHRLHAVDAATGRGDWRTKLPGLPEPFPSVRHGRVYLGANADDGPGHLLALDRRTGAVEWRRDLDAHAFVGAVTESVVLLREGSPLDREPDALVARDAETGAERWRVTTSERTAFSLPAAAGDALFVCRGPAHASVDAPATLERYDLATGERTAAVEAIDEWVSAPVVADGRVVVSTDRGLQAFG